MNPYKSWCWNKIINAEQSTIVIHTDDLKLSHKDGEQVSNIIAMLGSIYATIDSMPVHQGKLHHYLGMTMDFRTQGEVLIMMYDYIKKLINSLPEDMVKGSKYTTVQEYLL